MAEKPKEKETKALAPPQAVHRLIEAGGRIRADDG
jgi:hypothetical protein